LILPDRSAGSEKGTLVTVPLDVWIKPLFLIVWVIGCFAAINRRQIRRLRKLAAHYGGSLALYSLFLPAVTGIREGLRFTVHAGPRFLEIPGTLKIRLVVRPLVSMRIFRRSLMAKAAGKLRLLSEVKTGDTEFDSEFAVFAAEVLTAGSYLQQTAVRQALHDLFGHGFWMLVIDDHGPWVEKLAYDRDRDLELTSVSSVLRLLSVVATGVWSA
jgi:hypothetical protein